MNTHSLEVTRTARYCTFGNLHTKTKNIWFACHGYGQLAEFFIKKFEVLNPDENFVIAPEALNKFYLNGFSGRTGATWMTKEDRLNEIKDYLNYLHHLYSHIFQNSPIKPEQVKIWIVGFSQGAATACRLVYANQIKFDNLVVWAGNFPPDVDYSLTEQLLGNKKVYVIYGTQDELIQQNYFQSHFKEIAEKGIKAEIISFEGKHEIDEQVLVNLVKN